MLDGATDIVLNAGAVQEIINRVNTNKVLDDRFGNIRQLAKMTENFPAILQRQGCSLPTTGRIKSVPSL